MAAASRAEYKAIEACTASSAAWAARRQLFVRVAAKWVAQEEGVVGEIVASSPQLWLWTAQSISVRALSVVDVVAQSILHDGTSARRAARNERRDAANISRQNKNAVLFRDHL